MAAIEMQTITNPIKSHMLLTPRQYNVKTIDSGVTIIVTSSAITMAK